MSDEIDLIRLAADLNYWKQKAPDDNATHFCTISGGFEYLDAGEACDIPKPGTGHDDFVPMPKSVDQAKAMALIGMKWLESNAPDQLITQLAVPEGLPEAIKAIADKLEKVEGESADGGYMWDARECAEFIREEADKLATTPKPEGKPDTVYWCFEGSEQDSLETLHNDVRVVISAGTLKGLLDGSPKQGSVPEYDLPKGYSVRFDEKTGWHWYDDVNDRTTDCVFGSKADAAIGAWKDYSLSRWFNVDRLASYIERNFDPYLAEKVHYSSGPDSRSWQLESFSISTDAYNPEPFSRCLSNFLRQFLFTSTPTTPQADGWVRCDERLPTEEDWWVWIYDSEDGDIFHALWRDLKGDYENGHMNLSHWMPTGLKRPQPPKEGE